MKQNSLAVLAITSMMVASAPAVLAAPETPAQGQAVVTILPKNNMDAPVEVPQQNVRLKVNGRDATISGWQRLHGDNSPIELVILMDSGARASIGSQFSEIEGFVKEMPAHAKIAIGYMDNGRTVMTGPFSSDPAQVLSGLHLPAGAPGQNASPYFCLSDLAKSWPSRDTTARREVLMITDGVYYYNLRYDPEDPYVQAAIQDSVKAGLVVYSVYWVNQGRIDRTWYESNAGQNLLQEVTQATGGKNFWQGSGNPVSFQPYFDELTRRLRNQYELGFRAPLKGKPEVDTFKLKLTAPGADVDAPQQVVVVPAAGAQK